MRIVVVIEAAIGEFRRYIRAADRTWVKTHHGVYGDGGPIDFTAEMVQGLRTHPPDACQIGFEATGYFA
jgi:hypothetical protein